VDILCLADSNFFSLKDYVQIGGAETFLNGIYSTDSSVWISTIAGTIIVPKNIINIASEKPRNPVVINRVDVFSNSGSIQSYYSKDFNSLRLSHKSNNIAIHFKVAEYGVSKSTYKYTLEGLSNQILKVNDNKTIVYRNLLPGEYCFKVWRSSSSKNLIPKDKALISFEIVSPFYQKTLFQVIAILFLLVLVMLFTWYRSRFIIAKSLRKERLRQEAQDDLRKDMAIDFHDELGNHLAKIINLSSVLRLQNLDEKHLGILTRIEHSANELFVSTKNLIWSMKNENNNLHKIFYHLRDFSERLYDRTNVKLSFFNSSEETYSKINPKQSRDLSLILKEAITNSFKHSLSNTLEVSLKSLSDGESWFEIIDTGQGFDIDRIDVSSGLRNMQLRAGRSNFDLNIESHLNKGTRIKIKIKQA
jgi:signal transduction histidine kinase